jgi:hypothetical protein
MGLSLIRKLKPDVIWSTYPIATAHLIAYTLHRLTRIPWVAEFRDPMSEPDDPEKASQDRVLSSIEARTVTHCDRAVLTAPGALTLYRARYRHIPESHFTVIENGYDESAFADVEESFHRTEPKRGPLLMVHSGTIYPSARDPRPFLGAVADLRSSGKISSEALKIVLRATGFDEYLRSLIDEHEIGDIVSLAPGIPYRAALAEMLTADGLLLLQAGNCNYQLPAKLYEYLRAKRPIFTLTDPAGDTAAALTRAGIDTIAPIDSRDAIARGLLTFVERVKAGKAPIASDAVVAAASRRVRTAGLAHLLNELVTR